MSMSDSLKRSKLESRENHDFQSAFGPLFSVAKTSKISPARCFEYLQMLEMSGLSRHIPCCTLLKITRNRNQIKDCKNKNGGIFHATPAPHGALLSIEYMRICICWCLRRNSRRTQVADSAISWASTLVRRSFTLPLPRSLQHWWL